MNALKKELEKLGKGYYINVDGYAVDRGVVVVLKVGVLLKVYEEFPVGKMFIDCVNSGRGQEECLEEIDELIGAKLAMYSDFGGFEIECERYGVSISAKIVVLSDEENGRIIIGPVLEFVFTIGIPWRRRPGAREGMRLGRFYGGLIRKMVSRIGKEVLEMFDESFSR